MRPEKDLAALVWDALEFSCNAEVALGQATLEEYLAAGPTRWATERQMALIGEALGRLRNVAPEIAERVPNIHRIIGMRNVLVHGYLIINDEIVWQAATKAVPELIPVLRALLLEIDPG